MSGRYDADVTSVALCPWERQTLPVDHACIAGGDPPPPCPTEAGHPCGTCPACIAAQVADLTHGSPSDFPEGPMS